MNYYTSEINSQMLIYLLKRHGIKKIIISPGSTNLCFAQSVQQDEDFELYSVIDERSAVYFACGLAAESGEPVALSCTGATASRNYLPGLTEAYYRKLPVLAITSTQSRDKSGSMSPQFVDRSSIQHDVAKLSVYIPMIRTYEDRLNAETNINRALLELSHRGGGPVHIDLETGYSKDFSVKTLPKVRTIKRITDEVQFPDIPRNEDYKIGVFIGSHEVFDSITMKLLDEFCENENAVVLCDHTSNYKGDYGVMAALLMSQNNPIKEYERFDLLIHIGQVSGAYLNVNTKEIWRVSEDGEVCDTYKKMTYVFEMTLAKFFEYYLLQNEKRERDNKGLAYIYQRKYQELQGLIGEIPFSNIWTASQLSKKLPKNSVLHMSILNSLRSWNFFEVDKSILGYCNTGGFGIDGNLSSLIGASLAKSDKLYFGIIGDLAFFYDINSLGNKHVGKNLRILVVTNGCGAEFKLHNHYASVVGDAANDYTAAAGHYGNCSKSLVRDYAKNLGLEYLCANNKEEFLLGMEQFVKPVIGDKSIVFEIFTKPENESKALNIVQELNGTLNLEVLEKKVNPPKRYENHKWEYVVWGTGECFKKNICELLSICDVKYICDNNKAQWGKDMINGIKCISPSELRKLENVYVVIMIENIGITMQIVNQLIDMNITNFDTIFNFLNYK